MSVFVGSDFVLSSGFKEWVVNTTHFGHSDYFGYPIKEEHTLFNSQENI